MSRVLSNIICVDHVFGGCTMCISIDGYVYRFGKLNSHENTNIPIKISHVANVKQIACGLKHVICLDFDGNVYAYTFGENTEGQLGISGNALYSPQKIELPLCKQVSCGEFFTLCVSEDGNIFSFGNNCFGELGLGDIDEHRFPQKIESLENIDFVECGGYYVNHLITLFILGEVLVHSH